MMQRRDTDDNNSSATTELRQLFGIFFYKFDLEMLFLSGSWEF